MRRTLLVAVILITATPGATAHSYTDTQNLAGFPLNYAPIAFPCDPGSFWQGLHGYWYDATALSFGSHRFLITTGDPLDVDPHFYDSNCDFINNGGAALGGIGAMESGTIPGNTAWMLVWAKAGAGAFTLEIVD